MNTSMLNKKMRLRKSLQLLALTALLTGFVLPLSAQVPGGPQQPDLVNQLTQMLDLNSEQQTEIRAIIFEFTPQIEALQLRAQSLQQDIQEQIGPDFDEAIIRKSAAKLGELSGKMTALSAILQSKVEQKFTEEQRRIYENTQRPRQQPLQQSGDDGEADAFGRSPGHPHYGHTHP
jgi:hypothetical protein